MAQYTKTQNANKTKQQYKQIKPQTKKNVQDKSTQQKKKTDAAKSSSGYKWFLGSIVLIAVIVGVLQYDTNITGKGVFADSATGKMLKNSGLLPHVEKAYDVVMTNIEQGCKWTEQKVYSMSLQLKYSLATLNVF